MYVAFFDDSGTHEGADALTVAGYLMTVNGAAHLDRRWQRILAKHQLPHFHMVDNAHGNGEHARLTLDQRIVLQTRLISYIRSCALFGFAMSIDERQYRRWFRSPRIMPNAYTLCCKSAVDAIEAWMRFHGGIRPINFVFEAGHKHQGDADRFMRDLFKQQDGIYGRHSFVTKAEGGGGVQAADILAWLHGNYISKIIKGGDRVRLRRDYEALLSGPATHSAMLNTDPTVTGFRNIEFRTPWKADSQGWAKGVLAQLPYV